MPPKSKTKAKAKSKEAINTPAPPSEVEVVEEQIPESTPSETVDTASVRGDDEPKNPFAAPTQAAAPVGSPRSPRSKALKADEERIRVYLRIRPPNNRERSEGFENIVSDLRDPKVVHLTTGKRWGFDGIMYDNSTQEQVFERAVMPTLRSVTDGMTAAVIAYGQTGTGKTFTMRGIPSAPGVIPRVADYLFSCAESDRDYRYEISIAYIQVYLNEPRDLLKPGGEVDIHCAGDEVSFPGLSWHRVNSPKEFMSLADSGEKYKVVRATVMNADSSRGHSALVVELVQQPRDPSSMKGSRRSKLFLVDLAGYEQAAIIGQGSVELMQETKHINETLLALTRVMGALARRDKSIPYREQKLTQMLKEALGLKCKSAVLLTMGPSVNFKQQTYNSLYFGQSAMSVEIKATVQEIHDYKKYSQILTQKLSDANERIRTMTVWFTKRAEAEWRQYVQAYGEVTFDDAEIADILSNMPKIKEDFDDEDVDDVMSVSFKSVDVNNTNVVAMMDEMNARFKKQERRAQIMFEKEMETLRALQKTELDQLIASGADEEAIQKLKQEHQFELQAREREETNHREAMFEKKNQVEQDMMKKFGSRLKFLSARAKRIVAGRKKADGSDVTPPGSPRTPRSAQEATDGKPAEKKEGAEQGQSRSIPNGAGAVSPRTISSHRYNAVPLRQEQWTLPSGLSKQLYVAPDRSVSPSPTSRSVSTPSARNEELKSLPTTPNGIKTPLSLPTVLHTPTSIPIKPFENNIQQNGHNYNPTAVCQCCECEEELHAANAIAVANANAFQWDPTLAYSANRTQVNITQYTPPTYLESVNTPVGYPAYSIPLTNTSPYVL